MSEAATAFGEQDNLPKSRHRQQYTTAKGKAFGEQIVFAFEIPTLHLTVLCNSN
jgi:hypothetical protein